MRLLLPFLAVVVALSSLAADAKVVSFPSDNFSIDVPPDFTPLQSPAMPPHCRALSTGRNASNGNVYNVITFDQKLNGSPQSFLIGMQGGILKTDKGWKASQIRDETIEGRPFSVFTVGRETGSPFMLVASTFTDDRVYSIQTVAPAGNVENTPELNGIVQSFHFLNPVRSIGRNEKMGGTAYQIGYFVGRHLSMAFGFLVGIVLVFFLITRAAGGAKSR